MAQNAPSECKGSVAIYARMVRDVEVRTGRERPPRGEIETSKRPQTRLPSYVFVASVVSNLLFCAELRDGVCVNGMPYRTNC